MSEDIYRQLQERLDLYSMGFPATESGIELKILDYLFSEDDARLFLSLSHNLATASSIASRLKQAQEKVAAHLDDMAERGLLFRLKKADSVKYAAIPFVHGLFEETAEKDFNESDLAEMVKQYFDEAFDKTVQEGAEYFLRTVPVNQSIDANHKVASYEDAVEILKTNLLSWLQIVSAAKTKQWLLMAVANPWKPVLCSVPWDSITLTVTWAGRSRWMRPSASWLNVRRMALSPNPPHPKTQAACVTVVEIVAGSLRL